VHTEEDATPNPSFPNHRNIRTSCFLEEAHSLVAAKYEVVVPRHQACNNIEKTDREPRKNHM